MIPEDDFPDDKIGTKGTLDISSIVPQTKLQEKEGFDFRPLTELEKKEFIDLLEAKDRGPSAEPANTADNVVRLGASVA